MHVTHQFHTRKTTWQVMVITNKLIYLIRREMNRRIVTKKWDVSTRKSSEEMKKEMIEVSMEEIRTFWNGVDRMYLGTSLHWLRLSLPPPPTRSNLDLSYTPDCCKIFMVFSDDRRCLRKGQILTAPLARPPEKTGVVLGFVGFSNKIGKIKIWHPPPVVRRFLPKSWIRHRFPN